MPSTFFKYDNYNDHEGVVGFYIHPTNHYKISYGVDIYNDHDYFIQIHFDEDVDLVCPGMEETFLTWVPTESELLFVDSIPVLEIITKYIQVRILHMPPLMIVQHLVHELKAFA